MTLGLGACASFTNKLKSRSSFAEHYLLVPWTVRSSHRATFLPDIQKKCKVRLFRGRLEAKKSFVCLLVAAEFTRDCVSNEGLILLLQALSAAG